MSERDFKYYLLTLKFDVTDRTSIWDTLTTNGQIRIGNVIYTHDGGIVTKLDNVKPLHSVEQIVTNALKSIYHTNRG